eukprot:SAG31_NODE_1147_length_9665_cov_10.571399_11_plen_56_part_00
MYSICRILNLVRYSPITALEKAYHLFDNLDTGAALVLSLIPLVILNLVHVRVPTI